MFDYEEHGFIADNDKSKIKSILKNKIKLDSVCIDAYLINPYMLVLRSAEDSLAANIKGDRVIVRRRGEDRTSIMNVPIENVDNVYFKFTEDCKCRLFFTVRNVNYSVMADVC